MAELARAFTEPSLMDQLLDGVMMLEECTVSSGYLKALDAIERDADGDMPPITNIHHNERSSGRTLSPPLVSSQSSFSEEALRILEQGELLHACRVDNPELEIPPMLQHSLKQSGIHSLYPWQASCLKGALQSPKNVVYSAPTSAGKTLVSEILMAKTVLNQRLKAVFAVPLVAVAEEKLLSLRKLYGEDYVSGYYRGHAGKYFSEDDECLIAVCTFEKANMLVNRLLEEKRINALGMIVIDEVHMVGDGKRGPVLESLLSKLLRVSSVHEHLRIVCMSATIGNMDVFERWLQARVTVSTWRPIPLQVYIVDKTGVVVSENGDQRGIVNCVKHKSHQALLGLCQDSISNEDGSRKSTLVFCPTRNSCVDMCRTFLSALNLPKLENSEMLSNLLLDLGELSSDLSECLAQFIPFGVAFHHAGLTTTERIIVERAFKAEVVTILAATSTLAIGVNLPAERVIFRDLHKSGGKYKIPLTPSEYRQMAGRAGRPGSDAGQVFVFCDNIANQGDATVRELIEGSPDEMVSKLSQELPRVILEACLVGLVTSLETLRQFLKETLWWHQVENQMERDDAIQRALDHLRSQRYMSSETIALTELGIAIAASYQNPTVAQQMFEDLKKARQTGIILEGDLHLVYLIGPVPPNLSPVNEDWQPFSRLLRTNMSVLTNIGIEPSAFEYHLTKMNNSSSVHVRSLKRLWNAYILCDLIGEVSVDHILRKYFAGQNAKFRARIEILQENAVISANAALKMCVRLGWDVLAAAIEAFIPRLERGVFKELLPLFYIEGMTRSLARELFDNRFKTPEAVSEADPGALLEVLEHCPFLKFINNPAIRQAALKKRVNQMQLYAVAALDRVARQSPIQIPSQPQVTRSRHQLFLKRPEVPSQSLYHTQEISAHEQGMRLGNFIDTWAQQKEWAWKSNIQQGRVLGFAVCWNVDEVIYLDTAGGLAYEWLSKIFSDPQTTKICLDVQQEISLFPFELLMTTVFDPRIADWLLHSLVKVDLKAHAWGTNSKRAAADSCRRSLKNYFSLRRHLDDHHLLPLFFGVEMPVISSLAKMSRVGIPFNDLIAKEAQKQAKELQKRKIHANKRTRTSKSRQLDIYLKSLELCRFSCVNGRIHCTFDPTGSATGRITTRNPNVQCVPHVRSINATRAIEEAQDMSSEADLINDASMMNAGVSEVTEVLSTTLRSAFRVSEGFVLISLDYCQMELRLAAYFSNDDTLLRDLEQTDIFESMARSLNLTRKQAKTVAYGLMYGMQPTTLAAQINVPKEDAKQLMVNFYKRYQGLRQWKASVVSRAAAGEHLRTLGGRLALFPMLTSKNRAEREKSARAAVNWLTQGSCSDVLKRAMIKIDQTLHAGGGGRLVMQIHDELLLECHADQQLQCMSEVQRAMVTALQEEVPTLQLRVKCRAGPSWDQLTLVDLDSVLAAFQ